MRGFRAGTHSGWIMLLVAAAGLLLASTGDADDKQQAEAKAEAAAAEAKAAEEKKEKEDKTKKAPDNPLTNLIRGIFGGNKPRFQGNLIPADGEKPQGNGDVTARDHIDARAPYDIRQASRLRKATSLTKDGHYDQAAEWLQRVLDTADEQQDSVIRRSTGELESVRTRANRMLGRFPPAALEKYRLKHGPSARQDLIDARADGDSARIAEVANKYFHTAAGHEAANELGTRHVDRGEFGPAAHWFRQLLEAGADVTRDVQWQLKAAVAFREVGAEEELAELRGRFSDPPADSLKLGGRPVQPRSWFDGLPDVAAAGPPRLDEWTMLYGSPGRRGTAVGGTPLLLERWSSPLTFNQEITEQVELLLEDLADQKRTAIPAWHALAVDGKVIFRTLRGVQVVDASTGAPLWETRVGVSPERLLTGQPSRAAYQQQVFQVNMARNGILSRFASHGVDQHPLTGLLLRNSTFGLLSSHDDKLFVIEDQAILSPQQSIYSSWNFRQGQNDAYRRDWSSNKLTAYDLESGRPVWEVGGPETGESIQLPLAGTYFFGAPTPGGRELFVVGERENEVRLHALDPRTGEPLWSQLLAVSETRIEADSRRRWWNAQVAVAGGVIVCPTTLGWLVAVDRTSHAILWADRYSEPNSSRRRHVGRRRSGAVPNSTLNQRWCPSAPVIAGNRVLYTPSEYTEPRSQQTALICLNLSDGQKLWQKPRGDGRYLAGVFNERAVIVGRSAVTAVSLEDGTTAWSLPISPGDGNPAGMGVAVGHHYHLPLSSGQLWTINLTSGQVTAKSYLTDRPQRLGNLTMYDGMLLSLSPRGLTSFEQREAIVARIERRRQKNPLDAWALLREADIHLLNRQHQPALALLEKIPIETVSGEQLPHYRSQMIACLTEIIRSDFSRHADQLRQLAEFARRPEERLLVQRLTAERFEALGQSQEAFDIYRTLADEVAEADREEGPMVERMAQSQVTLPLGLSLGGRMRDLWSRLDAAAREGSGREIAAAAESLTDNIAAMQQFVEIYDFHPAGRDVRKRLAALHAERGEFAYAEAQLMRLAQSDDEQVAAGALHQLARLMQTRQLAGDAHLYYSQMARRYPDVTVFADTTARALYEDLLDDGSLQPADGGDRATWGNIDLRMERSSTNYSSPQSQELVSNSFRLPFFQKFRFEVDPRQKLAMIRVADGELYWLVPLRGNSRSSQGQAVAQAAGHRLFVLYRDVLHCLSPVERKLLWTHTVETRGRANRYYVQANQRNPRPMQSGRSMGNNHSLLRGNSSSGMGLLAVANSNYVCLYGRREFTVLDAATGEVRWTRDKVPSQTKLVGNEEILFMVPPENGSTARGEDTSGSRQNRGGAMAFRAADGKPLDVDNVAALLRQSIHISQRGLVTVENHSGNSVLGLLSSDSTVIRQIDPLSRKESWKHSFPSNTYFTMLHDNSLVSLGKDGSFALLDLETGQITELGRLDTSQGKIPSRLLVVADRDNVYLINNKGRSFGRRHSSGFHSVRVSGTVYAFGRRSGKLQWQQDVANQYLVLTQFEHSPVVLFATRSYVRKGRLNVWSLNVVALDKATGRKILDAKSPFNSSFRSFDVNRADRYIELRSYNDRIRLVAVDRPADEAAPPQKPVDPASAQSAMK